MTLSLSHPHPAASTAELLKWAHNPDPPYDAVRTAAPWLKSDSEVRSYLNGIVQGNIDRRRFGPLFGPMDAL